MFLLLPLLQFSFSVLRHLLHCVLLRLVGIVSSHTTKVAWCIVQRLSRMCLDKQLEAPVKAV